MRSVCLSIMESPWCLKPLPTAFHWAGISLVTFNQPTSPHKCLSTGPIFPLYLSTEPHPVSRPQWVCPRVCQPATPPPPVPFNWEWLPATPTPNKNSGSQPIWEIGEPGETYSNSSWTFEEADGHKGPLLLLRLRCLTKFRHRKEILSGSLHVGRQNCH